MGGGGYCIYTLSNIHQNGINESSLTWSHFGNLFSTDFVALPLRGQVLHSVSQLQTVQVSTHLTEEISDPTDLKGFQIHRANPIISLKSLHRPDFLGSLRCSTCSEKKSPDHDLQSQWNQNCPSAWRQIHKPSWRLCGWGAWQTQRSVGRCVSPRWWKTPPKKMTIFVQEVQERHSRQLLFFHLA